MRYNYLNKKDRLLAKTALMVALGEESKYNQVYLPSENKFRSIYSLTTDEMIEAIIFIEDMERKYGKENNNS